MEVFLEIHNDDGIHDDRKLKFSFRIDMVFVPTQKAINENELHNNSVEKSNQAKIEEAKANFIKATRDKITQSSKITKRKYEDLREEERIIVYRHLIGNLMGSNNYNRADDDKNNQIRHNLSEYLNTLFDIDKMLYFVAPEWWKPRNHAHQFVGGALKSKEEIENEALKSAINKIPLSPEQIINETNSTVIPKSYTANWSSNAEREDNYFITEESNPAPMGASLGWLLQLDGDELRNAFLNSPWVKAVIPIRPGKEQEAFEWLQLANVEGIDGLDATTDDGITIRDAINKLIGKLNDKYNYQKQLQKVGNKKDEFEEIKNGTTNESLVIDDRSTVLARPINKVYEHGFYPLKNSFAFKPESTEDSENNYYEVFDQWIEILPTDQIVPVPVSYDSITGRMIEDK